MKKFSDFADDINILDGDKIRIDDVLNQEIEVIGCRVKGSKFDKNASGKCLTLQIKVNDQKRVVFTGSDVIIDQMEKYQKEIPFFSTIKKINRYYTLT